MSSVVNYILLTSHIALTKFYKIFNYILRKEHIQYTISDYSFKKKFLLYIGIKMVCCKLVIFGVKKLKVIIKLHTRNTCMYFVLKLLKNY